MVPDKNIAATPESGLRQYLLEYFESNSELDKIYNRFLNYPGLASVVGSHIISDFDRILFHIAFLPQINPSFYDRAIKEFFPRGDDLPEFGGVRGTNHRGLLPTGETVQFILAGDDVEKRLQVQLLIMESVLAM
jgi:hypothetical protein